MMLADVGLRPARRVEQFWPPRTLGGLFEAVKGGHSDRLSSTAINQALKLGWFYSHQVGDLGDNLGHACA
jgi:hypothetical protein